MRSRRESGLWTKWTGAARMAALRWLAAAALCLSAAVMPAGVLLDVWAAGDEETRVFDDAGLFSRDETAELEEMIEDVRDETGFDAAVMTTDDAQGKSARMYAADRYDELDLGVGSDRSGVLFLIDMDNREIYLLTTGKAIRIFTDDRIDAILDEVYGYARDGDYAAGAETALENVVYYARQGIVSGQYNYDEDTGHVSVHRSVNALEFLLALAVSAAVAGGAVMTVKRQYNMEEDPERIANYNMAYRSSSEFIMQPGSDRLLDTFVTTMVIASAAPHNTGGGSHMSSSGRSTTFHSSSGRTHGGGGRKF